MLSNNVNVTFSWTVMAGIADYTLTLSYADGEGVSASVSRIIWTCAGTSGFPLQSTTAFAGSWNGC